MKNKCLLGIILDIKSSKFLMTKSLLHVIEVAHQIIKVNICLNLKKYSLRYIDVCYLKKHREVFIYISTFNWYNHEN